MNNLKSVKIAKIEECDAEDVFDITVPNNHNFFTSGNVLTHNCYVIGDELQNATWEQIRMLVTRMGFGSFFCLNGDPTQSDLPKRDQGGLHRFTQRLSGVSNDIDVVHFEKGDIVRDPLIALILDHVDVDLEQDDRKEPIIARKPATPYEAPPVITRHNGHDRIQKPALLVSVSNPPETN